MSIPIYAAWEHQSRKERGIRSIPHDQSSKLIDKRYVETRVCGKWLWWLCVVSFWKALNREGNARPSEEAIESTEGRGAVWACVTRQGLGEQQCREYKPLSLRNHRLAHKAVHTTSSSWLVYIIHDIELVTEALLDIINEMWICVKSTTPCC